MATTDDAERVLGAIPGTVREERISAANGGFGLANVLAAVGGSVLGNALYVLTAPRGTHLWWFSGGILIAIKAMGWATTLLVEKRPPADPNRTPPKRIFAQSVHDLKQLAARRDLFGAAAASAFLWLLAAMSQINVYPFATTTLHISQAVVGPLLGVQAAGVAVGSVIAGVWSGHDVEPGITPIGAVGIVVASVIMFLTPYVASANSSFAYYWSCGGLFLMGIGAGLYDIPGRVRAQDGLLGQRLRSTAEGMGFYPAPFCIPRDFLPVAAKFPGENKLVLSGCCSSLPIVPHCGGRRNGQKRDKFFFPRAATMADRSIICWRATQ